MNKRSSIANSVFGVFLTLLLGGCAGLNALSESTKTAPQKVRIEMAKAITGQTLAPESPTTQFTATDPFAYAWVELHELSGQHSLRWRWYGPDGTLYADKIARHRIGEVGKRHSYVRSAHRIKINGDAAETMPGIWKVEAVMDGRPIAKQAFQIAPHKLIMSDVDTLTNRSSQKNPNAYAVIVGIESYHDTHIAPVDFAQRDAEIIKHYLVNLMGYQEKNIKTLINGNATLAKLKYSLETWLANQVNEDSEVFVYYAGHGTSIYNSETEKTSGGLVPFDGDRADLKEIIYPVDSLHTALGALPSKKIVVAMDACFSGGGRSIAKQGARPMLLTAPTVVADDKLIVFSASQANQISSAFHEEGHGIFTYYFLKALRGAADTNADGIVDIEETFTYIKPKIETQARRLGEEQTPDLSPSLDFLEFFDRANVPLVTLPQGHSMRATEATMDDLMQEMRQKTRTR